MILDELREQGITITLEGNMLYVNPEERVTPEIVDVIKAHKKEIVQELKSVGTIDKVNARGSDVPQGSFWIIDGMPQPIPSAY